MPEVAFPLYTDVTLLDFAGATQIFSMAGFRVLWVGENHDPVQTSEGVAVYPNATYDHPRGDLKILFVPGGFSTHEAMVNEPLLDYVRAASQVAEWRGSVCTGAFLLAAAGRLRDVEATSYWAQLGNLMLLERKFGIRVAEGFPRGIFDDKQKIFTGGGVSSSIDLALELLIKMDMREAAQVGQLINQYAPAPPINAGDPSTAPADLVRKLSGGPFVENMRMAVERLLSSPHD